MYLTLRQFFHSFYTTPPPPLQNQILNQIRKFQAYTSRPHEFSICRAVGDTYPPRKKVQREPGNNLPMPSFFPPARLAPKKRGDTVRYSFTSNKQNGMENVQVPLPPTVPPTVPLNPSLPTQSFKQGMEQGQGREACTVRMLWKNRGGDIHRYIHT